MIWTDTKEHAVTPPPSPQCYLVTKEFQTAVFKIHQVGNLQVGTHCSDLVPLLTIGRPIIPTV